MADDGIRHRHVETVEGSTQPDLVDGKKRIPKKFNAQQYHQRKTFAKGLLDVALLSSNLNNLKQVLKQHGTSDEHPLFTIIVAGILGSIVLQVVIAFILLIIGQKDLESEQEQDSAMSWNDLLTGLILVHTIVNITVTQFIDF